MSGEVHKSNRGKQTFVCQYSKCGKTFEAMASDRLHDSHYCDHKCAALAREEKKGHKGKSTYECATCGERVERWPSQVVESEIVYCKKECFQNRNRKPI